MSCVIQLHNLLEVQICWLDTNQCSHFAMQKYVLVPNACALTQYVGEKDVGESQCSETDLDEREMSCQYLMVKIINYWNNLPRGCAWTFII